MDIKHRDRRAGVKDLETECNSVIEFIERGMNYLLDNV